MALPIVCHVVGARPNYMKIAPVYTALASGGLVEQRLVHTGQHYDRLLNDIFFEQLPLPAPDRFLNIGSGTQAEQTGRALIALEAAFMELRPQFVVVAGDVNSTLAGALAAAKLEIHVGHLEAGLRSFDPSMPEELNRRLTDHLATLLLAHSQDAVDNLAAEGIVGEGVRLVGNTMIDSLLGVIEEARALEAYRAYGLEERGYVLVTLHRPRLVEDRDLLRRTIAGLGRLATDLPVLFPAHPRTAHRLREFEIAVPDGVQLIEPLPYLDLISLAAAAAAVVTDSGGVQEETTVLRVPCFTLRDTTERPVTVTHGTNEVLGLRPELLPDLPSRLDALRARAARPPQLWDGHAGARAAREIERVVSALA
jgi:UDP-N-acetylglucosamine 2-epimerase (non-hydrolysing)